jgi:hypothetical protein
MTKFVTETFFLPNEVARKSWRVPAEIYNLYYSLQTRSQTGHVFVPIRSMQFMAVLDSNEIVFVDSQSYAVSRNEGGRMIMLAWQFQRARARSALTDPIPCELVYYERADSDTQLRLVAEFRHALELLDQRYRDAALPAAGARILKLQR